MAPKGRRGRGEGFYLSGAPVTGYRSECSTSASWRADAAARPYTAKLSARFSKSSAALRSAQDGGIDLLAPVADSRAVARAWLAEVKGLDGTRPRTLTLYEGSRSGTSSR